MTQHATIEFMNKWNHVWIGDCWTISHTIRCWKHMFFVSIRNKASKFQQPFSIPSILPPLTARIAVDQASLLCLAMGPGWLCMLTNMLL